MTLVLEDQHVAQELPMADCIEAMEAAFRDFANGGVNIPRIRYRSPTSDPQMLYGSNIHIGTVPPRRALGHYPSQALQQKQSTSTT